MVYTMKKLPGKLTSIFGGAMINKANDVKKEIYHEKNINILVDDQPCNMSGCV